MKYHTAVKDIALFLFDMDGTLYLGNRLFPYTKPLLQELKKQHKKYLFMTNNSSKSVSAYIEKLARLGIEAEKEDFLTSSQATAGYLLEHYPKEKIYCAGTAPLKQELRESGLNITDTREEGIGCIVCGFDTELTFQKLEDLSILLTTTDLPFIATNPDLVCPTEYGYVPDCGSVCQMLFNATGKKPLVIGKPSPLMVQLALEKYHCPAEKALLVGDRLYTDIACGLNADIPTYLVLSGETNEQMAKESEFQADRVIADVGVLLDELQNS